MNRKNSRNKILSCYSAICINGLVAGVTLTGLLGGGQSTPAAAQEATTPQFRVGNLIESGAFGDPKGWTLKDFAVAKGIGISRKGQDGAWGTATTTFQGPDGYYKIRIQYNDEGDGVSAARLEVGGHPIGTWAFDGILVTMERWKEFDHVKINKGDKIVLSARKGGYEYARIRGMEILPSKPPASVADAASIARKEYSMDLVPVSGHQAAQNNPDFLLAHEPLAAGEGGTHWVYLKKDQPLHLTARPRFASHNATLQYSLTKVGETEPVAAETLVSESSRPLRVKLRANAEGLYELKAGAAPGAAQDRIHLDFDAPGVTNAALVEGYFFVPKGTKALSVKTTGHAVMLDADGNVMLDEWFDKNATPVVEVRAGSDNQVWYFQGSLSDLAGVPPYLAARREAMLAPKEVLQ